jgi:hypothetical protein
MSCIVLNFYDFLLIMVIYVRLYATSIIEYKLVDERNVRANDAPNKQNILAIDTRKLPLQTLVSMKEAINKIIENRVRNEKSNFSASSIKLNSTQVKYMSIDEVKQIDKMLHQVIIQRIKNTQNSISFMTTNRPMRQKKSIQEETVESQLSPLIKSHDLPSLERFFKCGGSQLNFIPMKRQLIKSIPMLPLRFFKQLKNKKNLKVPKTTTAENVYKVCINK